MRKQSRERKTLVTARSLETLIRLSSAHAKLRLSRYVTRPDVDVVSAIMSHALYGDAALLKTEGSRMVKTKDDRAQERRDEASARRKGDDDDDDGAGGAGGGGAGGGAGGGDGKDDDDD